MSSVFKPIGKVVKGVGKALGLVPDEPPPVVDTGMAAALKRQEKRAEEARKQAMQGLMSRKLTKRSGGLRLLMSQERKEKAGLKTKMGVGDD